jgi:hypothetical protein
MTFTSPSETRPVHASFRGLSPPACHLEVAWRRIRFRLWLLSWGCPKITPPLTPVLCVLSSLRPDSGLALRRLERRFPSATHAAAPSSAAASAVCPEACRVSCCTVGRFSAGSLGLLRLPVRASQTSATRMPPSSLLPPLPFLPTSAVCSAQNLAGLLHPAANHGVHPVSDPSTGRDPLATADSCTSLPRERRVAGHLSLDSDPAPRKRVCKDQGLAEEANLRMAPKGTASARKITAPRLREPRRR